MTACSSFSTSCSRGSKNLWSKRNDLHEVLLAKLARDGPEDARPARVELVVDDHGRVLVEADQCAVVAAVGLLRPDDDRLDDVALLDRALRRGGLHRSNDDVADARVAPVRAPHHADAEELAGAGVVGDLQTRLLLDHWSAPITWQPRRSRPAASASSWRSAASRRCGPRPRRWPRSTRRGRGTSSSGGRPSCTSGEP